MNLPRWFILTVGSTTLILWVSSFVASVVSPTYKPEPIIGYAAMAVVAACFASDAAKSAANSIKRRAGLIDEKNAPHEQRHNDNRSGGSGDNVGGGA